MGNYNYWELGLLDESPVTQEEINSFNIPPEEVEAINLFIKRGAPFFCEGKSRASNFVDLLVDGLQRFEILDHEDDYSSSNELFRKIQRYDNKGE